MAMTAKQKQCLLAYLGYYNGAVDGIWGQQSEAAAKAFLAGRDVADLEQRLKQAVVKETPEAGDFWKEITYFDREEFRCKCGGRYCNGFPEEMKKEAVLVADRARRHFGAPGYVVSGLRCSKHNVICGGVANSQHMYGEAVDLRIQGVSAQRLLEFIKAQPEVRYGYCINETNVHFDIPKGER